MLLELARPVALLILILALYAVFHTAFLIPASDLHQRIEDSLTLLSLAACIAVLAGLLFCEPQTSYGTGRDGISLFATLPIRLFACTTAAILILFMLSWYLETHAVFYRDIRF